MKLNVSLFPTLFSFLICTASAQVALHPWVQVYGTVPGQGLGTYVAGAFERPNLPYKAAVSRLGNTEVYRLFAQTDTSVQQTFVGKQMQTGDLNGDGWKDIATRSGNTITIYWGTATSIDTISPLRFTGIVGTFNPSICISNIIGDSIADLIIGVPDANVSQGRVSIYVGGTTFDTIPAIVLNGYSTSYYLGINCVAGDLNNDGHNDLCVLGWCQVGPESQRFNYVDIWFGGATFDTTRDIRLRSPFILSWGLACFDANGDGIADLLWTNRDSTQSRGDVWVHFGGATFSSVPSMKLLNPTAPSFGSVIADAGDMNGDGYDDVVVAAYDVNQTTGLVFVFGGGPLIDQSFDAAVGMQSNSSFGWSVSSVGDVTGDRRADIIVGAPAYAFGDHKGYWGIFKGDSTMRVTDVKLEAVRPIVFRLYQSYPNPFNPNATIDYDLKQQGFVALKVYNVLGQEIRTLVNKQQEAGQYSIEFDGKGLPSGTYFYEIVVKVTDGTVTRETKKMLLLSAREKQGQDESEDYLLTIGRAGNDAALKELARIQYERAGGRLKQFLIDPEDMGRNMLEGKLVQQSPLLK